MRSTLVASWRLVAITRTSLRSRSSTTSTSDRGRKNGQGSSARGWGLTPTGAFLVGQFPAAGGGQIAAVLTRRA
jgi:hypothetical protein